MARSLFREERPQKTREVAGDARGQLMGALRARGSRALGQTAGPLPPSAMAALVRQMMEWYNGLCP